MEVQPRLQEIFFWPVRVYYEDTDTGGVVYYANYFKFAERARTELLRKAGVSQENLSQVWGYHFVVRRCQAEFILPARLDDELVISTHITGLSAAAIDFYQEIKRESVVTAQVSSQIVCVNSKGRPQRLPSEIRQFYTTGRKPGF